MVLGIGGWRLLRALDVNIFTTHTPVSAGFDRFSPELMETSMRRCAENELGISMEKLLALGRINANDHTEPFNMAYLAVRGSGAVNGVSRLHGEVSRRIFQDLFPSWPTAEVPVGYVTRGIPSQPGIRRRQMNCGRAPAANCAGRAI
jgi:glycogen phosphorylase